MCIHGIFYIFLNVLQFTNYSNIERIKWETAMQIVLYAEILLPAWLQFIVWLFYLTKKKAYSSFSLQLVVISLKTAC